MNFLSPRTQLYQCGVYVSYEYVYMYRLCTSVVLEQGKIFVSNPYSLYSNVQNHPDDDVYRRVHVSSERFHTKVWQYSNARQFLARAGWVEVKYMYIDTMHVHVHVHVHACKK